MLGNQCSLFPSCPPQEWPGLEVPGSGICALSNMDGFTRISQALWSQDGEVVPLFHNYPHPSSVPSSVAGIPRTGQAPMCQDRKAAFLLP